MIISSLDLINNLNIKKSAVTVGKFDGIHRGHELLINRIRELKNEGYTSVVCMINMNKPGILGSDERISYLKSLGIDHIVMLEFTEEFAKQSPESFIRDFLKEKLNAAKVVVGRDFRFGHNREGDITVLKGIGGKYGIDCEFYAKLTVDGKVVSSTEIRAALERGDMEEVEKLLGRPYKLTGEVVHGRHLGSTIGFPTINVLPEASKLLPKFGVYASRVDVKGREYRGITNIGIKPTVGGETASAETYIFDFDEDIYGETVTVVPERFIREEKRFPGVEELKKQIENDMKECRY
jgi:riboflavin kinase/FMN adenylyltransferase